MSIPWNVSNKQFSQLLLWRLPDENFRIMRVGDLTPVITGYQYVLIHQSILAPFLGLSSHQVIVRPRTIINHVTGQEWNDYSELDIIHSITPATMQSITGDKIQIWKYDTSYLFVSSILKNALEKLTDQLEFSLGFSYSA